jgi:hypothetical protein
MTAIKPDNAWFNQIQLMDHEEITLSYPANHTQGKRAVGGKLFVTNMRLAFAPNRIDANLGGKTWELPLTNFASTGTDKPRVSILEIFSGALRTRLSIQSNHGILQYFVVSNPQKVAADISSAIQIHAEQDGTGQPATRPVLKSEGGDKPQPEAEGRSR